MICKRASICKLQSTPSGLLSCFGWAQSPYSSVLQSRVSPIYPEPHGALWCTATLQVPNALLPKLRCLQRLYLGSSSAHCTHKHVCCPADPPLGGF